MCPFKPYLQKSKEKNEREAEVMSTRFYVRLCCGRGCMDYPSTFCALDTNHLSPPSQKRNRGAKRDTYGQIEQASCLLGAADYS